MGEGLLKTITDGLTVNTEVEVKPISLVYIVLACIIIFLSFFLIRKQFS